MRNFHCYPFKWRHQDHHHHHQHQHQQHQAKDLQTKAWEEEAREKKREMTKYKREKWIGIIKMWTEIERHTKWCIVIDDSQLREDVKGLKNSIDDFFLATCLPRLIVHQILSIICINITMVKRLIYQFVVHETFLWMLLLLIEMQIVILSYQKVSTRMAAKCATIIETTIYQMNRTLS